MTVQYDDPLVSICMITYNHEPYIAQALDSILMQIVNFKYEIVIGEDCSTDGTRKILLAFQKKYPDKFKLLLNDQNIGMMPNFVTTLNSCSGKYIALLEGDDYWTDPLKLQLQIDQMEKNQTCGISFHPSKIVSDNIETNKTDGYRSKKNKIFTTSEIVYLSYVNCFCPTASFIFKKSTLNYDATSFLSNAPIGDYYLTILCSINGGALYLNNVMAVYRTGLSNSWSLGIQEISKRTHYFEGRIQALEDMNILLNKTYQKEISFAIECHYYELALLFLKTKRYKDFNRLFKKFFETNKSFKMELIYFVGMYTKSSWLMRKTKKILFVHPLLTKLGFSKGQIKLKNTILA